MSDKLVFEGTMPTSLVQQSAYQADATANFDIEDGGQALILSLYDEDKNTGGNNETFVRVQSWDDDAVNSHPFFRANLGKKVRVTVEIID